MFFPLPPSSEQNKICSRVQTLLNLCEQLEQHSLISLDAHQQLVETLLTTLTDSQNADELAENWARISEHFDTLFTTEASIDALKQTILQLAVMVNWYHRIRTTNRPLNCSNVLRRKKRNW